MTIDRTDRRPPPPPPPPPKPKPKARPRPQATARDGAPEAAKPKVVAPVKDWNNHISSGVGPRESPGGIGSTDHKGIDIAVPQGTPVQAAKGGKVVFAGDGGGYGNLVVIDHGDGTFTKYAHLSKINVREGQTVEAGELVGAVGSTGNSTGPHLHFEVRRGSPDGEVLDPVKFLEGAEEVPVVGGGEGYSAIGDGRTGGVGFGSASASGLPSPRGLPSPGGVAGALSNPGFSGNLADIRTGGAADMLGRLAQYGITQEWLMELLEELGVPPEEREKMIALILAVIKQESGGSATARSPAGAIGLMQLMPGTAAGLGVDPYDPKDNVRGGVKYLLQQLKTFGNDIPKALAAYNAGPGNVQKYGGIPPFTETQNYVRNITKTIGLA